MVILKMTTISSYVISFIVGTLVGITLMSMVLSFTDKSKDSKNNFSDDKDKTSNS